MRRRRGDEERGQARLLFARYFSLLTSQECKSLNPLKKNMEGFKSWSSLCQSDGLPPSSAPPFLWNIFFLFFLSEWSWTLFKIKLKSKTNKSQWAIYYDCLSLNESLAPQIWDKLVFTGWCPHGFIYLLLFPWKISWSFASFFTFRGARFSLRTCF